MSSTKPNQGKSPKDSLTTRSSATTKKKANQATKSKNKKRTAKALAAAVDTRDVIIGRPLPDRVIRAVVRFDILLGRRTMPLYLGLAAFVLFILTANTSSYSVNGTAYVMNDTYATYLSSWRLASAHTLDLSPWAGTSWVVPTNGRWVSNRLPGSIFWGVPFYWALNGSGEAQDLPQAVAASTATAIAVGFLFATFRRFVSPRLAFGATALVVFGTSTWTVSSAELLTHGPGQMMLAIAMYCITCKRWWIAGLAYAGAVLVRPHTAVIAACAGIAGSISERSIKPILKVGVTSILGVVGLYIYYQVAYGQQTLLGDYSAPASAAGQASNWLKTPFDVLGNMFSLSRGVFVLSPFLLLLVPGLIRAWKVAPGWIRAQAIGGLIYLAIQLSGNVFYGGAGFYGYRLQIETLTVAAPLLILCWQEWTCKARWRRVTFWVLSVLAVLQYSVGAFMYVPLPRLSFAYNPWKSWLAADSWNYGTKHGLFWALLVTVVFAALVYVFTKVKEPESDNDSAQDDKSDVKVSA